MFFIHKDWVFFFGLREGRGNEQHALPELAVFTWGIPLLTGTQATVRAEP